MLLCTCVGMWEPDTKGGTLTTSPRWWQSPEQIAAETADNGDKVIPFPAGWKNDKGVDTGGLTNGFEGG